MYPPNRPRSPYGAPPAQNPPQISPGTLTYTTSIGPDGRTIYQPFKAVAASYQTPNGIVHGIQWVPAEATQILPAGAQPASPEFKASWERSAHKFPDPSHDWQRDEEKRRRKREKEEAKNRGRRRSSVGPNQPQPPGAYPPSPYSGSSVSYTPRDGKGYADIDRQFGELDISGRHRGENDSTRPVSGNYGNLYGGPPGPHSKPYAATGPHISAYANPSPNMRAADVLPPTTGYPGTAYTADGRPIEPVAPIARAASPHPPGVVTSGYNYPQPPRSRATTPIPSSGPAQGFPQQPRSRATSPMPSFSQPRSRPVSPMPVPEIPSNQPAVPDCFSRPVNTALPYPPFDAIKIQDMDDFLGRLPKLPMILQPHDVNHHDWIRLTQDLSLAWAGKMPIPPERAAVPPRRSNVVAELLHAWNTAYFLPRSVEVVLYKGNVRYSGPKAGVADLPYKRGEDDDDDDSSSSSSEDSSSDEPFYGAPQSTGLYGGPYNVQHTHPHYAIEVHEAKRKRREEKAERKRRRKEKRMKRKQREREKKYSLYIVYTGTMPGGFPATRSRAY